MDLERESTVDETTNPNPDFAEPTPKKPLEILRDTEGVLRRTTIAALVPILPAQLSKNLEETSQLAEDSLQQLAEIDLDNISDRELRSPRILVGLSFVGFGALMVIVLSLYQNTLHPELSTIAQVKLFWSEYVWFVCLGVAGMFTLGREAMRPKEQARSNRKRL